MLFLFYPFILGYKLSKTIYFVITYKISRVGVGVDVGKLAPDGDVILICPGKDPKK